MKCPKCGNEFEVRIGASVDCSGCKVLTSLTTVVTVQCNECKLFFQVPVMGMTNVKIQKEKK